MALNLTVSKEQALLLLPLLQQVADTVENCEDGRTCMRPQSPEPWRLRSPEPWRLRSPEPWRFRSPSISGSELETTPRPSGRSDGGSDKDSQGYNLQELLERKRKTRSRTRPKISFMWVLFMVFSMVHRTALCKNYLPVQVSLARMEFVHYKSKSRFRLLHQLKFVTAIHVSQEPLWKSIFPVPWLADHLVKET